MSADVGLVLDSGQLHCPSCGCEVEISKLFKEGLERQIRMNVEARFKEQTAEIVRSKDVLIEETQRRLNEANVQQAAFLKQKRELEEREQTLELDFERRLTDGLAKVRETEVRAVQERAAREVEGIRTEETRKVRDIVEREANERLRLKDLELVESKRRLADASQNEIELVRLRRDFEDSNRLHEIEVERRLGEATLAIRDSERKAQQAHFAREAEVKAREQELILGELQSKVAEAARREMEAHTRIKEASEKESDLLRARRQLEEESQQQKVDAQRTLAEQTVAIRASERKLVQEQYASELEFKEQARERAMDALRKQAEEANAKADGAEARIREAEERETSVLRQKREIEEREQKHLAEVERKVAEQIASVRETERKAIHERFAQDAKIKQGQQVEEVAALRNQLNEASQQQAELLRKSRERDAFEGTLKLDMEKRLTAEASAMKEQFAKGAEQQVQAIVEQHRLADAEKEAQMQTWKRRAAELQRAMEQKSQQTQGEAQEILLQQVLGRTFPFDVVEEVEKGSIGADVMQQVRGPDGRNCGSIIWECKRTKGWSDGWLAKLRDDQRETRATVAVIVSETLPTDVRHFEYIDGVWVCSWACAPALAAVLRVGLIDIAQIRTASEGRGDKIQLLYAYMTGTEFKTRITGIMEAFSELNDDLVTEKRAMQLRWKKRERHLERALENVTSLYGDLQGIAGATLGDLPAFSLNPPLLGSHEGSEDDDLADGSEPESAHVEFLFSLLPPDGSTVGNGSLSKRFIQDALHHFGLKFDLRDYDACKQCLVDAGRARRAPGRGGALAREVAKGTGTISLADDDLLTSY